MALGWAEDDGRVWHVTDRARKNADFMAGRRGDARRRPGLPHGTREGDEHDYVSALDSSLGVEPELPIVVVCPHCGTPQRLEPTALGVRSNAPPTFPGHVPVRPGDYASSEVFTRFRVDD